MKQVVYTPRALADLRRHGNMAARIRKALNEYAEGQGAHANNVTQLVDATEKRMRIGDFRALFDENDTRILVVRIGPRGNVYE